MMRYSKPSCFRIARASVFFISLWRGTGANATVRWINIEVVIRTVTLQMTTALNQTAHELAALHSEIESSCFSLGTNALSAASSTIS
jgi:hypothetical protein